MVNSLRRMGETISRKTSWVEGRDRKDGKSGYFPVSSTWQVTGVSGVNVLVLWNRDLDSMLLLADDSDLAGVRCGIVDPEIVAEFPNQLFSVLWGAGFNIHSQKLSSANVGHL